MSDFEPERIRHYDDVLLVQHEHRITKDIINQLERKIAEGGEEAEDAQKHLSSIKTSAVVDSARNLFAEALEKGAVSLTRRDKSKRETLEHEEVYLIEAAFVSPGKRVIASARALAREIVDEMEQELGRRNFRDKYVLEDLLRKKLVEVVFNEQ